MDKTFEDKLKSVDVVRQKVINTYDDRMINNYEGLKRQDNIIKNYFPNDNIVIEIKTDTYAKGTGNFFIETHQIMCGEKEWRDSGIRIKNDTDMWMMVKVDTDLDNLCEGKNQQVSFNFKEDIKKICRIAVKDKRYQLTEKGKLPDGVPEYVLEGHRHFYTYVIDKCANGSLRYSRGILVPFEMFKNPIYLTRNI